MTRETFLKRTTDHARQDEFIGLSSYKERVTAVVYRGPYLNPKKFVSGSVPICTGEISSGLDIEVILMDRELSQRAQIHVESNKDASNSSLTEKEIRKRALALFKSLLSQNERDAVSSIISRSARKDESFMQMSGLSTQESLSTDRLAMYIGYWAYNNTYKLPKSIMGSHKIDFTKSPSPTVILDISIARGRGAKSISNISIVAVLYEDTHDIRGTDIVSSGVSAYIKDADVSDTNSLAKNIQNGMGAVLNDDCNRRMIELRRINVRPLR